MATPDELKETHWFVMRDLKRANAKNPAYKMLAEKGVDVFTPMMWRLKSVRGQKSRVEVPCIPSLLFVHDKRETIDPIVEMTPTLQYRWLRNTWREPMTVSDADMARFMQAVEATPSPRYYLPSEITPQMLNRQIRIVGGPLDGREGTLVTTRGSKIKRLLVELPNLLAVAVEVNPEYIQFV